MIPKNTVVLENSIPGIIHDLKTPITSIIGFIELLKTRKENYEHNMEYYDIIESESLRLLAMVEDILKIYKKETVLAKNKNDQQDVNLKVKKVLTKLLPMIKKQGIIIRTDFEEGLMLQINENELIRILTNIIENAVKYSDKGKEVVITTKKCNDEALVEIKNEGITLLKEEFGKIFEKFYRGESAKNSNVSGSGIGLSVVRELVKKSGGKVRTSSHDKKTIFTVKWPTLSEKV